MVDGATKSKIGAPKNSTTDVPKKKNSKTEKSDDLDNIRVSVLDEIC